MNTPSESNGESRIAQWEKAAAKSAPDGRLEDLNWRTPDGITVKPLYTAEDVQGLAHADTLPGFPPYVRGPQATMYAVRPWTFGSTLAFRRRKNRTRFIAKPWPQGGRACRWHLIWPLTAVMTRTTPA